MHVERSAHDLSHEHDALAWIDLGEFGAYDTLGQRRALVELGLVEE